MTFVNVGAYVNGERPKTKKALREALAGDLSLIAFDGTSGFAPKTIEGHELERRLESGVRLIVVGPDPYRDRRWYARIFLNAKNKVIVE